MATPYDKLSEEEKESDRKEADRFLALLEAAGSSTEAGGPYPYPNNLTKDVPKGYERIEAYFKRERGTIVVLGWPEDDSDHNCDAMGCGSCSHVIARFQLKDAAGPQYHGNDLDLDGLSAALSKACTYIEKHEDLRPYSALTPGKGLHTEILFFIADIADIARRLRAQGGDGGRQ